MPRTNYTEAEVRQIFQGLDEDKSGFIAPKELSKFLIERLNMAPKDAEKEVKVSLNI